MNNNYGNNQSNNLNNQQNNQDGLNNQINYNNQQQYVNYQNNQQDNDYNNFNQSNYNQMGYQNQQQYDNSNDFNNMNQSNFNNQMNYQYQQQYDNFNNFGQPNNQKNSNKVLYIIIGILSAIIIGFVAVSVIMPMVSEKKSDNDNKNINEYEEKENKNDYGEDEEKNTEKENNSSNTAQETITFKGFQFIKNSEYTYTVEENMVGLKNNDYAMTISVVNAKFSDVLATPTIAKNVLLNNGYTVGKIQTLEYSGKYIVTYEIGYNGNNGIYYIVDSSNENYVFDGIMIARDNSIDYNNLIELFKVIDGVTYVGNYSNYSSSFSTDLDI